MKKILFVFAAVLLVTCSGNDNPEEEYPEIPLQPQIPTEFEFRGLDFPNHDIGKAAPFTYYAKAGDKAYLSITILRVDPAIPSSTYADYSPIFSVATLNADGNWTYDPPILLPSETLEAYIIGRYYGNESKDNYLAPETPLFTNSSYYRGATEELPGTGTSFKLYFFSSNARMFFTGIGAGKKIWVDDAWRKSTLQINSENGKTMEGYETLQPNYIATDADGNAAFYSYYQYLTDLRIAITDADADEPDSDDAAWHILWDVWEQPEISVGLHPYDQYNYVVDCSVININNKLKAKP